MNLRYTQSLCAAILLLLTVLPFADKLMAGYKDYYKKVWIQYVMNRSGERTEQTGTEQTQVR